MASWPRSKIFIWSTSQWCQNNVFKSASHEQNVIIKNYRANDNNNNKIDEPKKNTKLKNTIILLRSNKCVCVFKFYLPNLPCRKKRASDFAKSVHCMTVVNKHLRTHVKTKSWLKSCSVFKHDTIIGKKIIALNIAVYGCVSIY